MNAYLALFKKHHRTGKLHEHAIGTSQGYGANYSSPPTPYRSPGPQGKPQGD